jgi:hypothetical protein
MEGAGASAVSILPESVAVDHSHSVESHIPAAQVAHRAFGTESLRLLPPDRTGLARVGANASDCCPAADDSSGFPMSCIILPVRENIRNLQAFFHRLGTQPFRLAWEPRGSWPAGLVRDLCAEHNLIHCVDPFESEPVYGDNLYWRLHGRGSYQSAPATCCLTTWR